jgi:hypothetical protein
MGLGTLSLSSNPDKMHNGVSRNNVFAPVFTHFPRSNPPAWFPRIWGPASGGLGGPPPDTVQSDVGSNATQ